MDKRHSDESQKAQAGKALEKFSNSVDYANAVISPWPFALPLAVLAVVVGAWFLGQLSGGVLVTCAAIGYVVGLVLQVAWVRFFHRLFS
jgi:hypothetical protein